RDAVTGIPFDLGQAIDVPGVEDQRLLADRISSRSHSKTAVRVVKMVRGTDRDIVDLPAATPQLVDVSVEPLEFGKEMRVGIVAVEDADGVIGVIRNPEIPTHSLDRSHVAGRHIASSSYQCE